MTDSSYNSFNTNSYRTKISLDDIDKFIHDIQNDTNDIIRDFHTNKLVMINYFSDISILYEGYEESILLLVYLVLCMKTKLTYLDKKIENHVFNYLLRKDTQSAGTLDSDTVTLLRQKLPLAFESIYSQYAIYKIRLIEHLLTTKSILYLDEVLSIPVTNVTTQIVKYEEKNYFNSYNNFYDKIMVYIKNEVFQIENQFRNNNLSEIYRYYVYRKIIEFDITEETYKNKNDTLREYIIQNKSAYDIMKMLYGSIYEDTVNYNVIDEFRTKVTEDSDTIILIMNILEKEITNIRPEGIDYYSNIFDRISKKVEQIQLLKHTQSAGMFLKKEVIPKNKDKPDNNTIFRERINKILYTVLRSADSRHDFLFDEKRPSAEFQKNKNEYLKSIKFIPELEYTEVGKKKDQKKDYEEILNDLNNTEIFKKLFVIGETNDIQDINLEPLLESMERKTHFEDHIMAQMNKFIYNLCQIDHYPADLNITNEFLNTYRPGNFILDKILNCGSILSYINTAQYINKPELFILEQRDFDEKKLPEIFKKKEMDNLLFVIYDDSILIDDVENKQKRLEIIKTVKQFFGTDSVKLLVDYGQKSGPFFKIFTLDDGEGNDVFVLPKFSLAQEWDAASKRGYDLNITEEPQILTTDLLDKDNNIPICEKDYKIILDRKDDRVIAYAGINVDDLSISPDPIDSKNFTPSVNILSNLISDPKASENIRCKLFYLKNSGDWGQVTSANQNKSFLLSEDRLCSYYSFLTNTSTIYTIERGAVKKKFITILHRGDIEMSWQNMVEMIQNTLLVNNYYIFYENINITLDVTYRSDKQKKTEEYEINFILKKGSVTYTLNKNSIDIKPVDINSKFKKTGDLKTIQITKILYIYGGINVPKLDITIIKNSTVNNPIPTTIITQIENYTSIKKEQEKCRFLVDNKCNEDYEKIIYSNFFDKFYPEILDQSLVQVGEETTLDKLKRIVEEEIINYISENIMIIYLSFLNSNKNLLDSEEKEECKEGNDCIGKDKRKICTKKYKAVITKFFNKLNLGAKEKYKLEYISFTDELTWKSISQLLINREETYENQLSKKIVDQTKIRDEATAQFITLTAELKEAQKEKQKNEQKIVEIESNKSKAYKLKNYNPKITDYKIYNMSESKIVNDLNLYKYNNSEQNVFISSILTTGIWDIFDINPFIYSLYSKFLSINPKLIPKNLNKSNIDKIKFFYSFFDLDRINPVKSLQKEIKEKITDLKDFITSENDKYGLYITPQRGLTDKEYTNLVIEYLNMGLNIYELSLFMYLYDFIIPTDFPEKNIFKVLDTKIEIANIKLLKDKHFKKIDKPYVGEYLKMLRDLLPTEDTDLLVSLSDPNSPIVLYFTTILKELDITKHKNLMILEDNLLLVISNYVTELKKKEDSEYYFEVINILKSVKETLKNNDTYINEKDNIKTTILWFIDLLYGYLSDYDKIEYIKDMNKFQYCKLTINLLKQIKETIQDYPILKHVHNFLTEVLEKEVELEDVPNLFVIHSDKYNRCSNIVAIYNDLYKEPSENSSECTVEDVSEDAVQLPKAAAAAVAAAELEAPDVYEDEDELVEPPKAEAAAAAAADVSEEAAVAECIKKIIGDKNPKCIPGKNVPNTLTVDDAQRLLDCKGIDHSQMKTKKKLCPALVKNGLIPDPSLKKGGHIDYNKECQIM
jgi:hypothetical protein